jgi:hypothetical protein
MNASRSKRLGGVVLGSFLLTLSCHAFVDQDGDGMSDVWEREHGFSIAVNSPPPAGEATEADPDGDGYSNLAESQMGIDPFSGRSPDGILTPTVVKQPGFQNLFTVSWPSRTRLQYVVYASADLNPPNWFFVDWAYGTGQPIELGIEALDELGVAPDKLFWRLEVYQAWDWDGDGVDDYEESLLGTDYLVSDSDLDGMPDGWEFVFDFDPLNLLDGEMDGDDDGLSNAAEYRLSLNPIVEDSDNDGILDGEEDADNDGLTNAAELTVYQTDPRNPDSDLDGLPDEWEITWSFNPKSASGVGEGEANADEDDLSNFDEYLNGTNPRVSDSDGDGTNDSQEVGSGGDPNSNGDQGQAPPAEVMMDVPFTVSDPSGSHSEKWTLIVTGKGPDDQRTFKLTSPDYGTQASKTFKLRKWNGYEITISHAGTDPDYLTSPEVRPDYDWEATVDGNPPSTSKEAKADGSGVNTYFSVGQNHWLVENREAVLTTEKHGDDADIASGKKAYLIPVKVKDNVFAAGVDETSITVAPDAPGYRDKFWIMAPAGGPAYTNHSLFDIQVKTPTPMKITCPNATPDPDTITIGTGNQTVAWTGAGSDPSDNDPTFKVGEAEDEVALQIGVKSMKKRTVSVAVHPVASVVEGRDNDPPNLLPTEAQIKAELDKIYGQQINAFFEVSILSQENIAFDVASSNFGQPLFTLDPLSPVPIPGDRVLDNLNWTTPEMSLVTGNISADFDLHVFLVGGGTPIRNFTKNGSVIKASGTSLGEARAGENYCVVDGDRDGPSVDASKRNIDAVLNTIAHEIGHLIIKDGHPDEDAGAAPLPGTDHARRLMASGTKRAHDGDLMVKGEWDAAEVWLKARNRGDQ